MRGYFSFLRCALGLLVTLIIISTLGTIKTMASTPSGCQRESAAFLETPSKHAFLALEKNGHTCWTIIGLSNENLNKLNRLVGSGDRWAAEYLVKHLRTLDGGNLEDSLIALGRFSEHDMRRLLIFANKKQISQREFMDALVMLPLPLSDNPNAQLASLTTRKDKVLLVTQSDLSEQKILALKTINDFSSEIRSHMSK